MKRIRVSTRGLTLVELMAVIGIILLLLSIVMASIMGARENTRERKRVSDLANIEFALTLYAEQNREFPDAASGAQIGVGDVSGIDDVISQFSGGTYTDPSQQSGVYEYWYDSSFTCSEAGQTVIYARTMEQSKNANFNEVCTASTPDSSNGAGANSYIQVLGIGVGI